MNSRCNDEPVKGDLILTAFKCSKISLSICANKPIREHRHTRAGHRFTPVLAAHIMQPLSRKVLILGIMLY